MINMSGEMTNSTSLPMFNLNWYRNFCVEIESFFGNFRNKISKEYYLGIINGLDIINLSL